MCENILFYNVVQNCSHFFQLLFFILKRGRKKNIFFLESKYSGWIFLCFVCFCFFEIFFCCFYIFFGGNKYPTNKGMCSLFSLHNLVFKKSNQAKNSLITIVTSKHLKNVQAEWQQRNGWNFNEINFTKIFVKLISRKKMVSSACTFFFFTLIHTGNNCGMSLV